MAAVVQSADVLTRAAVHALIARALAATQRHDADDELMSCLARHGLVLRLPGLTLRGRHEVMRWYRDLAGTYELRCQTGGEPDVRLTSPLHAEGSLELAWSARRQQGFFAGHDGVPVSRRLSRLDFSTVLQEGTPRIRTCVLSLLPPPLPST